ncbi:hypothetical protein CONLIGDRAFT_677984 [Coniochaeta ligniaria NRRL 30616]|uniref:Transcription factor domain-containing protein n=1 Tax=Coniochaeta ligniaria NRRL 30616 TaxID=1408157 RepID=A0A1J7JNQ2_9PEZI|nr:hypothetical protein CONLIGDRAFT_677984 [Coniochaeta ligniaria NRRL 30616]
MHPAGLGSPEDRELRLWRHYRYDVAPWLDICDMTQTFGMAVPRIAAAEASEACRAALLEIPAAYLEGEEVGAGAVEQQREAAGSGGRDAEVVTTPAVVRSAGEEERGRLLLLPLPDLEGRVLAAMSPVLCAFIRDMPVAWQGLGQGGQPADPRVVYLTRHLEGHAADRGVMGAIYWLFVRLCLSAALANATSVPIRLPPTEMFAQADPAATLAERTSSHAHQALLLCAKTLAFCFPEDESSVQAAAGPPVVETWRTLVDELDAWHASRPGDFEPMVDMDHAQQQAGSPPSTSTSSHPFPTILFATGAAVLANQLYHTAMLLLLSRKPRSWRMAHPLPASLAAGSTAQSPLWHAQRACGIALNNDRRDCWDPCLVASLLVAARGMTHEEQQAAVLSGLARIADVTRWRLAGVVEELKREWDVADMA